MLEFIVIISLVLIGLSSKKKNRYIALGSRLLQISAAAICIYLDKYIGVINLFGVESITSISYVLIVTIIAFDIESLRYKRYLKEMIFILVNILILSNLISVILASILLILVIFLRERKAYFIDYISLFIFSLITLIYFSELSTTVLTTRDTYYIYLTTVAELIFFPLVLMFALVEYVRLWGVKRNIQIIFVLIPLLLIFKLQHANYLDQMMLGVMAPLFIVYLIQACSKLISISSLSASISYLFIVSLLNIFVYVSLEQYEVAITSALIVSFIFSIYRYIRHTFKSEKETIKVVTWFSIMNLSALPVSFSGLMFIDAQTMTGSTINTIYLLTSIVISLLVFGFTVKNNSKELNINLLEASTKIKIRTFLFVCFSIFLICMNLSSYVSSESYSKKLVQILFGNDLDFKVDAVMSYNLYFIIFLILSVVIGYFIKVSSSRLVWKLGFKIKEVLRIFTTKKVVVSLYTRNEKSEKRITNYENETEVSSYLISFYILTIFLIISLIIVEL